MQHRNNCNWTFRTRRPSSTVEPYRAATSSYNLFLCCVYSARQKPISCSYHCIAMSLCDIILCNNGISHNIHLCMNVYVRMYIHTYMYMYVCTCTVAVSRPVQLERYAFNLFLCWLHSLHSLPSCIACLQAKFLPGTNNLHLVSAARDGLIIHHILSPSGQVAYTKKVAKHFDSAHKASASLIIRII